MRASKLIGLTKIPKTAENSYIGEHNIKESEKDDMRDEASRNKKNKKKKGKKDKKHKKKPHKPDFTVPKPPSKTAPPGPGYSPQTLTLLGYTQYFANLTHINNDSFIKPGDIEDPGHTVETDSWHEGKHKGKHPKHRVPKPNPFQYEVEYATFTDAIYKLDDMTVKSYLKLAHRIGQYKPEKGDRIDEDVPQNQHAVSNIHVDNVDPNDDNHNEVGKNGKKHKEKKHHGQHEKNKVWLRFIQRAFVGSLNEEKSRSFDSLERFSEAETQIPWATPNAQVQELHDGEL